MIDFQIQLWVITNGQQTNYLEGKRYHVKINISYLSSMLGHNLSKIKHQLGIAPLWFWALSFFFPYNKLAKLKQRSSHKPLFGRFQPANMIHTLHMHRCIDAYCLYSALYVRTPIKPLGGPLRFSKACFEIRNDKPCPGSSSRVLWQNFPACKKSMLLEQKYVFCIHHNTGFTLLPDIYEHLMCSWLLPLQEEL